MFNSQIQFTYDQYSNERAAAKPERRVEDRKVGRCTPLAHMYNPSNRWLGAFRARQKCTARYDARERFLSFLAAAFFPMRRSFSLACLYFSSSSSSFPLLLLFLPQFLLLRDSTYRNISTFPFSFLCPFFSFFFFFFLSCFFFLSTFRRKQKAF